MLINASACIGHGACKVACPMNAIDLVFGTEKRGVDIPNISPEFETNVAGIYIAGELGGMGLIRKAAEQGRQAIASIRKRKAEPGEFDVVIVGCGPAGLSAGLSALHHKMNYKLIEQEDSLGGAVYHFHARFGLQKNPQARRMFKADELLGTRVLVVDDLPEARTALAAMLVMIGMRADVADSVAQARAMLEKCGSGAPMLEALKALGPTGRDALAARFHPAPGSPAVEWRISDAPRAPAVLAACWATCARVAARLAVWARACARALTQVRIQRTQNG